jgi:hypothetical protein
MSRPRFPRYDNIVWGTSRPRFDNIVWGTSEATPAEPAAAN